MTQGLLFKKIQLFSIFFFMIFPFFFYLAGPVHDQTNCYKSLKGVRKL